MLAAWVDGVAASCVPLNDRALHYGDSVFTTLRVHAGMPCWLWSHLERLQQATGALRMPMFDWPAVHADIERAATHPQAGVVKVILSRGDGARGYASAGSAGRRLVCVYPAPAVDPDTYAQGVALRIADLVLSDQPALAGLKHGNRLEQVLARSECDDPRFYDALLADTRGHVVSTTSANLFARFGDEVRTPLLSRSGVAGVARAQILQELAGAVVVTEIPLDSLYLADELFLSNCLRGIVPVRSLGDHRYTGKAAAQALMRSLHAPLGLPVPG